MPLTRAAPSGDDGPCRSTGQRRRALRTSVLAAAVSLLFACNYGAHAAERTSFTVPAPDGPVDVDRVAIGGEDKHPAVIVLSGSKGLASPAYVEMTEAFERAGIDVFLVHALSGADLDAITRAGSAKKRIAYYATRLPHWIAAVRAVVDQLNGEPRHAGRVGVLGISLGAQIAAAASIEHDGIRALVLVDGGFPEGSATSLRTLPPSRLIWGSSDREFPLRIAEKLLATAHALQKEATLKIYEGGTHDFFLKLASPQAREAQRDAAEFLKGHLD